MSVTTIRSLLAQRDHAAAIDACARAIAEAPDNAELHFLRGVALAEAGRIEEAERSIRDAIALHGEAPWTWDLVLVNLLRDRGALGPARAAAEALLAHVPDRPEIHNATGLTLQALQDHAAAGSAFARALDLNPRYAAARTNLAAMMVSLGKLDDAIATLRQGVELVPGEHGLLVALGRACEAADKPADARSAYAAAARIQPASFEALWRLGRIAQREFDLFSAISAFEAALKLRPDDVELWIWTGNAYLDVAPAARRRGAFAKR
jgi:Flp pilus assembly protein TadD